MDGFDGKVVWVTGAGGGMGREAVLRFAAAGASVMASDLKREELERTVDMADKTTGRAVPCVLDICDAREVGSAAALCAEKLGGLDALINFAGITQNKKFEEISTEEWDRMLGVNLKGSFLTSQAAFRVMMGKGGGSIINISSAAIHSGGGHIGTAHYTASKAGVVGLTRAIAKEGARHGIRANAICPGLTETGMTSEFLASSRESSLRNIPLGRVGTPGDMVEAVMFLCSEKAAYITGATLNVNGGLVMQ